MVSYIIAIPSYKRYNTIIQKTLHVLEKHNISPKIIYVFVANNEEKKLYTDVLDKKYHNNIIVGKLGLRDQRNFIQAHFPVNMNIVEMDDDIKEIYELSHVSLTNKYNKKMKPISDLDGFIKNAFKQCMNRKLNLWGVYPIDNAYFMNNNVTTDLRLIVGPFWGMINSHNKDLILELNEKEDSERTLKYFVKDGGVMRFNNVSIETTYYKTPGGMQANGVDRKAEALKSANYLINKYPKLVKLNMNKKSGIPDIRFIR